MAFNWEAIKSVDTWLDENVAQRYKDHPLAQDWARIAKICEESGESIQELISYTGQNPRKGTDTEAYDRMLSELADCVLTSILAIQHFTKDVLVTQYIVERKLADIYKRIAPPVTLLKPCRKPGEHHINSGLHLPEGCCSLPDHWSED